jgi:hypothetical protein
VDEDASTLPPRPPPHDAAADPPDVLTRGNTEAIAVAVARLAAKTRLLVPHASGDLRIALDELREQAEALELLCGAAASPVSSLAEARSSRRRR